jgi:iron complex transport system ATP-binding protein
MSALHIEGLSVFYGARRIIEALSLPPIAGGAVTALVGPNAAGKTTLLRALAGIIPARGSVRLDGLDLARLSVAQHAAHVTYMPQALPQRVALTVLEATLSALMSARGWSATGPAEREKALATLARLGIADLAMRGLDELSGGQRQLASLAQSIVREPAVLLLDEPTSALDVNHQLRVMQLVEELARERGMIAVVVLHDIALASRWCRRLVVLSGGAVAADGPPEAAVTPDMLARVYGVEARVERCSRGFVQVMVDSAI